MERPCKVVGDYPGFYILQCADGKKYIVIDSVFSDVDEHVEWLVRKAKEICPDCE